MPPNLRRLGAFEAAAEHINNPEQHTSALSDDAYGSTIRTAIDEVHEGIDNRNATRQAPPSVDTGGLPRIS